MINTLLANAHAGTKGRGPEEIVIHPDFHVSSGTFMSYKKDRVQMI